MAITMLISMRAQDCHTLRSTDCKFLAGNKNTPRYFHFVFDKTKNEVVGESKWYMGSISGT